MRSFLFVPGNNPSMVQNADVFPADAVIFDLEDSVHVAEKDNARRLLRDYLTSHPSLPQKVAIRINAMDTPYYKADLEALVADEIDYIVLPKATVTTTQKLGSDLFALEQKRELNKHIDIIPIVELAASLVEVCKIAATSRVVAILFGAEDYCAEMEIKRTLAGEALFFPRSQIAVACRANGIIAIDTPFTDVADDEALLKDCHNGALLGMTAKAAIHPRQVGAINEAYSPAQDQIDWAKKVVKAEKEASSKGLGVFSLDGKMIDKPVIERARKTLAKAKQYNLAGQDDE